MIFAENKSLVCFEPKTVSQLRLFCFPCAGGAATMYRSWSSWHTETEIWCANYPGRGTLHNLPLAESIDTIVNLFLEQKELFTDKPFALYGHSFGALITYLVAYQLEQLGIPPQAIIVSARRAPHLSAKIRLTDLSDQDFLKELERLGGLPTSIRENAEMLDFYLPTIKSDLHLNDKVLVNPDQPLETSIFLYSADQDKVASGNEYNAWKALTNKDFQHLQLAGDHFFIQDEKSQFRNRLCFQLDKLLPDDSSLDSDLIAY